jgi:hypothetical protein
MECRDAQFYLRLRRHTADELGADVTGALDGHLGGCPACAADARAAAAFDRAIGSAMRAVPVPADLRARLITRAAAQRGAVLRHKLYRAAAACAAALLLVGIGFGVFSATRPKVDTDLLVTRAEEQVSDPEGYTRHWLQAQKLPDQLPRPFDFSLLDSCQIVKVQGRDVPVVAFRSPVPGDNGFARVYVFRADGPFDLAGLPDAQGSRARAQAVPGTGVTYVLVYTGLDLQPFLRTRNGTREG